MDCIYANGKPRLLVPRSVSVNKNYFIRSAQLTCLACESLQRQVGVQI